MAREHGEDGGWGELMELAERGPARSTNTFGEDAVIHEKVDFDGTTWRGVQARPGPEWQRGDPLPPTRWEVTTVGDYWGGRGVVLGPTELGPYQAPAPPR